MLRSLFCFFDFHDWIVAHRTEGDLYGIMAYLAQRKKEGKDFTLTHHIWRVCSHCRKQQNIEMNNNVKFVRAADTQ